MRAAHCALDISIVVLKGICVRDAQPAVRCTGSPAVLMWLRVT